MTIKDKLIRIATMHTLFGSPHAIYAEAEINAIRCERCKHWQLESVDADKSDLHLCEAMNDANGDTLLHDSRIGVWTEPEFFCALFEAK